MQTEELQQEIQETSEGQSFFEHLEDLRKRIIFAVIGLVAGCIIAGVFIDPIIEYVLLRPALSAGMILQNLKPMGQPYLYFKVILVAGVIISFPFMLYQLWKFIAPGLYSKEKRWVASITFFTTLCFLSGIAFSYFFMIPSMYQFAASFGTDKIKNFIDVNEHWSFMVLMMLSVGLFFELPVVSFILSRMGIVTPAFLKKYRRHSAIVILLIAAMVTPSPDPVNQLIVAVPVYVLYEISVIVSHIGAKGRLKNSLIDEKSE